MSTNDRLRFDAITKTFPASRRCRMCPSPSAPAKFMACSAKTGPASRRCSASVRRLQADLRQHAGRWHARRLPPSDGRAPGGICMIHQELQQVPHLTVAQNMFLRPSSHTSQSLLVARAEQERRAGEALAMLDPGIDPAAPISSLKVAQRQIVENRPGAARQGTHHCDGRADLELTPSEFERLAEVIARLAGSGVAIVYVSHKIGRSVPHLRTREHHARRARLIDVVRSRRGLAPRRHPADGGARAEQDAHVSHATEVVNCKRRNLTSPKIRDVSFRVAKGGSGRDRRARRLRKHELLRFIAGVDRLSGGASRSTAEP